MTKYVFWRDGQTHGIIAFESDGTLIVTNNTELWSAKRMPRPFHRAISPDLLPPGVRLQTGSLSAAEPEYRLPLEWAKKTVVETNRVYTTEAGKLSDTRTIEYTSPATKHLGSVSYTGFEKIRKRSGHSLESIHRAVNSVVARAIEVWGWQCVGLEVKFHESGKAFGLAYDPAPGRNFRKISLNALLLQQYDLNSVARVAIHELCHHYREETWPRPRGEPHDRLFCEALSKADPEIAPTSGADDRTNRCRYFNDTPDTALASALKERRRARIVEPTWAPEAGVLQVSPKRHHLRIDWIPRPGFKWTRWTRSLNDDHLLELLKHFSPSDWRRVSLVRNVMRYTLDQFARETIRIYPRQLPKSRAYVQEVSSS